MSAKPIQTALLAGGDFEGERREIQPGQMALQIEEDGMLHHYAYESTVPKHPDTVVFSFRLKEPAGTPQPPPGAEGGHREG